VCVTRIYIYIGEVTDESVCVCVCVCVTRRHKYIDEVTDESVCYL